LHDGESVDFGNLKTGGTVGYTDSFFSHLRLDSRIAE